MIKLEQIKMNIGFTNDDLKNKCAKTLKISPKEIKTIKRDKLTKDEVERSKEMLKGNYILSYESTGARMQGAGRSLLLDKPVYSQDEALKKIEAVNVDSVAEIIDRVLDTSIFSAAVVGPVDINKDLFNFISH